MCMTCLRVGGLTLSAWTASTGTSIRKSSGFNQHRHLRFRQHRDGRGRSVNAPLRFGGRHALHAMNAAFVTQFRKTDSPETLKITSFSPPISDGLDSRSSVQSSRLGVAVIHRQRSAAKIAASLPPVPARFRLWHRDLRFRPAAAMRLQIALKLGTRFPNPDLVVGHAAISCRVKWPLPIVIQLLARVSNSSHWRAPL